MSTGTSEWYTAPKYIEAARAVMGSIELDPASIEAANQIVKAERYFTKEQNGLLQEWEAETVWLNPPYGRVGKMIGKHQSTIKLFVDKCLDAYNAGKVKQAIILATAEVNAKWFIPLCQFPVCIPDHRVNFIVPIKLDKYSQMFGTTFVYLGPNVEKFIDIFGQFGPVMARVSVPKEAYQTLSMWEAIA